MRHGQIKVGESFGGGGGGRAVTGKPQLDLCFFRNTGKESFEKQLDPWGPYIPIVKTTKIFS